MTGYDPTDPKSIEAFAQRLVGHSLREILEVRQQIAVQTGKGAFGDLVEKRYFGIDGGSRPGPDFGEAGVELKVTPVKKTRSGVVPKERLVLGMINYTALVGEQWETSSFLQKNSLLLLIFYMWEQGVESLDYVFHLARLWEFPAADLEIIRRDWERIAQKVREGRAHELSEGDTFYLAASTKAADSSKATEQPFSSVPAKPRAFSLKPSYMKTILAATSDSVSLSPAANEKSMTLEDYVASRFAPYIGKTADEIAEVVGMKIKRGAKNFYAVLTKRILGVGDKSRIREFEKAGVVVKTMRLRPSGTPKEDVSFPAFKYLDLINQSWDESSLRDYLTQRFFFVVYQLDRNDVPRLLGTEFWTMPLSDVDTYGKACFDRTVAMVAESKADYLPKKSENIACHVRPHGRDSHDTMPLPNGTQAVRKSFWLNGSYIAPRLKVVRSR